MSNKFSNPPAGCQWHHFDSNGHLPIIMGTKCVYSCLARTVEKAMNKFRKWKQLNP